MNAWLVYICDTAFTTQSVPCHICQDWQVVVFGDQKLTSCYVLNIPMLYNIMYIGIMKPTHIPTLKKNLIFVPSTDHHLFRL